MCCNIAAVVTDVLQMWRGTAPSRANSSFTHKTDLAREDLKVPT